MKLVSKGAMVAAWAHVIWISAGLAAPATALAQTAPAAAPSGAVAAAGGDVIELKTGGLLRGTLIDAIPNGHARIQLVTGEVATVPWQEIAHIERAAAAAPAGPPEPTVYVHIEGSEAAHLQRDTGRRQWDDVCAAPCDQAVSSKYAYRIGGAGIRNSRPFGLVEDGKRDTLYVDEGSKTGFALGIVGVSVGSFAATVGLLVVLVSSAEDSLTSDGFSSSSGTSGSGETAGWTIAGLGLVGIVGGIVLIANNAHTGVSQTPPSTSTGSSRLTPSIALGPSRSIPALWGTKRESLAPPVMSVPLFSAQF